MTEKRFRLGYVCGDYGLIDNNEWTDLHSMSENSEKNVQICINKMNELADENEQLKKELQRLYDVATLNKAIGVLENKYDKMLSDGSDEIKDAMRHTVLRCIEDLDGLKDDITAR